LAAAAQSGHNLVLVNTERHAWVEDPHKGYSSAPDMLVTHPCFYRWNKSEADSRYDGAGFLFGLLAQWDLRDCPAAVVEFKTTLKESRIPLGEGIDYVRRIASATAPLYAPAFNVIHVMIAGQDKFQLVTCDHDTPLRCVWGEWGDRGSLDALVQFFIPSQHAWLDAITTCCRNFSVELVLPTQNEPSCFLGRGATGRVFQVCSLASGVRHMHALKVSLGNQGCVGIAAELFNFTTHSSALGEAKATTMVLRHHVDPDRQFAGLLVSPVGSRLPVTKKAVISAIDGFAHAGLHHGDARRDNVVWISDEVGALWVDLERLAAVAAADRIAKFAQDLSTFAESYGIQDIGDIRAAAAEYLHDRVDPLVTLFKCIWAH
jgi:hypothetical protein